MEKCLTAFPGWRLVSSGRLLWTWTKEDDSEPAKILRQLMAQGELVPPELVTDLILKDIEKHRSREGG